MATTEQIEAPKGPSFVIQIAMLAAMTVAALGVGWMSGSYLKSSEAPPKPAKLDHSQKAEEKKAEKPAAAGPVLTDLAPITTNLAAPEDVWVRMELSIVYDAPQPAQMTEAIHQDLLAFLRTLSDNPPPLPAPPAAAPAAGAKPAAGAAPAPAGAKPAAAGAAPAAPAANGGKPAAGAPAQPAAPAAQPAPAPAAPAPTTQPAPAPAK